MAEIVFVENPTDTQIAGIIALYRANGWWGDGPDDAAHVRRLVEGSHCFALAIEKGEIAGMGRALSDGESDAYIQDVTVGSGFRGRGLGAEIVTAIVERLVRDGIRWIGLVAEPGRETFYERLGFCRMEGAIPLVLRV